VNAANSVGGRRIKKKLFRSKIIIAFPLSEKQMHLTILIVYARKDTLIIISTEILNYIYMYYICII